MTDAQTNKPDTLSDVVRQERDYVVKRRRQLAQEEVGEKGTNRERRDDDADAESVRGDLIGLALSGGGIRSATTNLGILQALAQMRLLPLVDYVSTVSGGGYIGCCLSSLLSLSASQPSDGSSGRDNYELDGHGTLFTTATGSFPLLEKSPTPKAPRWSGDGQMAHLRTHGHFMIARRGIFKRDALRAVGNLLTGITSTVLTVLLTLLAVASAIMASAAWLSPDMHRRLAPDAPGRAAAAPEATGLALLWQDLQLVAGRLIEDLNGRLGRLSRLVARGPRLWCRGGGHSGRRRVLVAAIPAIRQ